MASSLRHGLRRRSLGPWFLPHLRRPDRRSRIAVRSRFFCPAGRVSSAGFRNRTGHGFTDLGAAGHLWSDFQNAAIDPRHVLREVTTATELADRVIERAQAATIAVARARPPLSAATPS